MDIPQTLPLKKSDTYSIALPNISKTQSKIPSLRTARANTTRHHSVFLDKIKDLTKDVRYQQMQTTKITEQQKQLKGLLRQFNQQTYNILGRFIDRPADTQSSKKPRASTTSMIQIKDKQLTNSNDVIQICQRQIALLQKKCENLKYVTVEDFQRKIQSIKAQMQQLINSNKQIIKGNVLRGLAIKRGDNKVSNQVSQIQQQKLILQKKKQRLSEDMKCVNQQQQKMKQSHNKADQQIKKLSEQYNKYQKQSKQGQIQKQLIKQYQNKKRQYNTKKQRIQQNQTQKIQKNQSQNRNKNQIQTQTQTNTTQPQQQQQQQNIQKSLLKFVQSQKKQQKQLTINITPISISNTNSNPTNIQPQNKKIKKQIIKPSSNRYQYQYLKLLKQLDQITKKSKQQDQNIKQYDQKIENSKKQLNQYTHKLTILQKKSNQNKKNLNSSQINDKNKQQANQQQKKQQKKEDKKWSFF